MQLAEEEQKAAATAHAALQTLQSAIEQAARQGLIVTCDVDYST